MSTNQQRSKELFARAQALMPGGVNSPVRSFKSVGLEPFIVSHAKGAYLYDVDGNSYIDYINSWGPLVLGHAHPVVVDALNKQIKLGTSYGACSELEADLAGLIISLMPNIGLIRFVNSGTEAAMSVLRLARAYTKRNKILKFAGCYHGHLDPLLVEAGSGVVTLGIPGSAGVPESFTANTLSCQYNDAAAVTDIFKQFPDDIAAVIVEPVVGNSGLIKPKDNFLTFLREITQRHQSLLIFDEVMTGFRVHLSGAQKLYDIRPDLTMLGKVIGGGLPVGAFGGRKEIMSLLAPLGPVYQAGTLSGNPLAMAAGIATISEWAKGDNFSRTAGIAASISTALREFAQETSIPLVSASIGTMFGFFFQENPVTNYLEAVKSDKQRFNRFFKAMLDSGVFFAPSQFEAGFVSLAHIGKAFDETLSKLMTTFKSGALK